MALELFAGHAARNLDLGQMFAPRDLADFSAELPVVKEKRADGPQTINIFIDSPTGDTLGGYEYAVSVVEACSAHTVYAIQCTKGSDSQQCGPNAAKATATENASAYTISTAVTTSTAGVEVKATVIEECKLDGTTAATCSATLGGSAQGQKYTTSATTTYTDAATLRFDVSVTGGNDKLANPTGKCSAASGLNTRAVALWGFLGAVGAVGVLAL
ncbi:hypothetical protein F4777DRAFT_9123 [Nemania sp. FL0916]|nr:hypothetical protein F4777DRAFT_9123 [Nemania sp. FL0916]